MNTRIEIPLELPEPHFEDERTIAAARQVVPIQTARRAELWRKLRTAVPLVLAALMCGGLGAAAVNYYERGHKIAVSAQPVNALPVQPAANPTPAVLAASSDSTESKPGGGSTAEANSTIPPASINSQAADTGSAVAAARNSEKAPARPSQVNPELDVTKITRKRRVHPVNEESQRGAGRITDVFTGPNP